MAFSEFDDEYTGRIRLLDDYFAIAQVNPRAVPFSAPPDDGRLGRATLGVEAQCTAAGG